MSISELKLFQILEEIKGQVRQNTLLLQAITRREATEVGGTDFGFPLNTLNDVRQMEDRLSERETRHSLVKFHCVQARLYCYLIQKPHCTNLTLDKPFFHRQNIS